MAFARLGPAPSTFTNGEAFAGPFYAMWNLHVFLIGYMARTVYLGFVGARFRSTPVSRRRLVWLWPFNGHVEVGKYAVVWSFERFLVGFNYRGVYLGFVAVVRNRKYF